VDTQIQRDISDTQECDVLCNEGRCYMSCYHDACHVLCNTNKNHVI